MISPNILTLLGIMMIFVFGVIALRNFKNPLLQLVVFAVVMVLAAALAGMSGLVSGMLDKLILSSAAFVVLLIVLVFSFIILGASIIGRAFRRRYC